MLFQIIIIFFIIIILNAHILLSCILQTTLSRGLTSSAILIVVTEGKQMQLLLNAGGPDRVSRVQMAEAVAQFRGYDTLLIKSVSASSVRDKLH